MKSPNSHRRRLIAGGAAVAALGLGGTGIAIAQSGGGGQAGYTSSVTVADSGTESADHGAALAAQAKITPEQAKAAAIAAVPGTAGKVELEDEDGNVVFGVEVTTASGSRIDVKVDAGNATVLAQEPDDGSEGAPETESPNAADTPRSSTTGK